MGRPRPIQRPMAAQAAGADGRCAHCQVIWAHVVGPLTRKVAMSIRIPGRSPRIVALAATTSVALTLGFSAGAQAATQTRAFAYTGGEQTFTVPAGVHLLHVVAVGGEGAAGNVGVAGGRGGSVTADLPVTRGRPCTSWSGATAAPAGSRRRGASRKRWRDGRRCERRAYRPAQLRRAASQRG